MRIKIFHGDNLVESRKALSEEVAKARKLGAEVVTLNGPKANFTEVRSALESSSLFGEERLVVMENFLSLPPSAFKRKTLSYLKKGQFGNNLVLWEGKGLKTISLKAPTKLFRLDPVLFRFLESLQEGGGKKSLELLAKLGKKEKPEMIFYMIVRQVRLLILARDLGASGLSGMASWQQKKLISQAKFFTLDQLLEIYRRLLEIDFAQKTSTDSLPLSSRLDLLVSEI